MQELSNPQVSDLASFALALGLVDARDVEPAFDFFKDVQASAEGHLPAVIGHDESIVVTFDAVGQMNPCIMEALLESRLGWPRNREGAPHHSKSRSPSSIHPQGFCCCSASGKTPGGS